jgi:serine/threonine protein kinase
MSTLTIGRFQVLGTLGSGAHSSIVHIRRAADGRAYALKIVPVDGPDDHKFLEQARHEFRVAGMLDHPNVVKVHALEEQRDWLFRVKKAHLLIEYVDGKTLDDLPQLPVRSLLPLFVQVASGLVHLHRRGVYHADLKPNNLMLTRDNRVKIIDFGLAWVKGQAKGRVQGTPEYMAPETAARKIVNERTDVYNFGATMYRLLTGRLPPSTLPGGLADDPKSFASRLKPVAESCPEAPAALCDLVHRCLTFESARRPARMSEVQGELDQLNDELGTE